MGVSIALILCSIAIGIIAHTRSGSANKAGLLWAGVHFAIASFASILAAVLHPWIFPEALVPHQGLFEKKLTTGMMVISFFVDKIIYYGPLAAVTGLMLLFVMTAVRGPGRASARQIDWKARMRV